MQTVYHAAATRGYVDQGWLQSRHTFSFGSYHDAKRVHFGLLRVVNDDVVAGGAGFGTHAHVNMEIITIPLHGALAHEDNAGHAGVIRAGDIQVMSAGSGITHSEMNAHPHEPVNFLQIWVFPKTDHVAPRYQQTDFGSAGQRNVVQTILSPHGDDGSVWIHQDAWFSIARLDAGVGKDYAVKKAGNGVYAFVIKGEAQIDATVLHERDGLGVWDTGDFTLRALTDTEVLLMDVPMTR